MEQSCILRIWKVTDRDRVGHVPLSPRPCPTFPFEGIFSDLKTPLPLEDPPVYWEAALYYMGLLGTSQVEL